MQLDLNLLTKTFPQADPKNLALFVDPLNKTCIHFNIDTVSRIASFVAQTGHESGQFRLLVENLNYSAQALNSIFAKYFPTQALAAAYARKPEKIANRVYANRMGNGDESTGDGWAFRGHGLIQITGRTNTTAFAKAFNMTLADASAYLLTPEGAAMGAGWFWDTNNLNQWADKGDITRQSKIINGGTNGLEERLKFYAAAKAALLAQPK